MIKGARKYLTEEEASLSQEELSKRIAEEKKLPPASVYDSCDVLDQMLKKGPYKTKVYVEGGSNYGAHYTYNTGHYEETYDEYNTRS